MKKFLILALLALAPRAAHATPTRLLTTDNMNQIVPDDWDATTYYSLSPNFKNHWYADAYDDKPGLGWGFVDVGVGTLVLWFNKPFEGGALYNAATSLSPLGLTTTAFTSNVANAWEPREKRVATPDNKIALGFAVPVTDSLNLALCFRYAAVDNTKNGNNENGSGVNLVQGLSAGYQNSLLSSAYTNMSATAYSNTQAGTGWVVSPQFSYLGSRIDLDFKFDMVWDGINNSHAEDLSRGADTGNITQTLKDQGRMSWYARPKLRYMLDSDSSLVLRASYGQLDLSTLHHVKGSFSGPGIVSAMDQAGYDLTDQDQELGITQWDATLGLLKTWDHGKDMILWGFVPSGQTVHLVGTAYQTRATATTYNDVVRQSVQDTTVATWAAPLVMGSEVTLSPWCKARAVVQRNLFASSDTKSQSDTYDATDTLTGRNITDVSSDYNPGWVFNTGFGLSFGQFSWDTALNTGFLASGTTTGFINPLYQSSFTYDF